MMQSSWWPLLGWVGLISRGPIWQSAPDARGLADTLRDLRHPVLVNPEDIPAQDLGRAGFWPIMTPVTQAIWDLSGGPETRWARMHQKWRNRARKGLQSGLKIRHALMPLDIEHWILQRETQQRKARRYRGLPGGLAAFYEQVNPGQTQIFWAERKGKPVAGMLFLRHGAHATYFLGHTDAVGRARHAHNALLATAGDWFADHGVTQIDLGSLDTMHAPGLARFKLGCGAHPQVLGGTWLYARRLAPMARFLGKLSSAG